MSASSLAVSTPPAPRTLTTPLRFVPYGVDLWCPVLRASELGPRGVVKTELLGERVVLFRGEDGTARAFDDRCPHRGVALSLGKVEGQGLRCAYHGWCFGPDGGLCDVPGMGLPPGQTAVRTHPVREAHGLLWMWLGAPAQAEGTPLPDVAPWGSGDSADLLLSLDIRAHWSLVLDNGLDLFHQHLHVGVPFFFRVHELVRFGEEDDAFTVRYRASLKNAVDRARYGFIDLAVRGNVLRLDFSGLPIIHAIAAAVRKNNPPFARTPPEDTA
jgi:nitrite reductase/ring-hydroxylating ferredoxin subunit